MKIDPSEAQKGDVISYVDPVGRQVRHHRVQRRQLRKLGRHVVVYKQGKPVVVRAEPAPRVCFLPQLHDHEVKAGMAQEWVAIEDVIHARRGL